MYFSPPTTIPPAASDSTLPMLPTNVWSSPWVICRDKINYFINILDNADAAYKYSNFLHRLRAKISETGAHLKQ